MNGTTPAAAQSPPQQSTPSLRVSHLLVLGVLLLSLLGGTSGYVHDRLHAQLNHREAMLREFQHLSAFIAGTSLIDSGPGVDPFDPLGLVSSGANHPFASSVVWLEARDDDPVARDVVSAVASYRESVQLALSLSDQGRRDLAGDVIARQVRPNGEAVLRSIEDAIPLMTERVESAERLQSLFDTFAVASGTALVVLLLLGFRLSRSRSRSVSAEHQRFLREQDALTKIGELSVSDRGLAEVLPEIARQTLGIAGIERCAIQIWCPETDDLELLASESVADWPGTFTVPDRLPLRDYPRTRWVLEHHEPIRVEMTDPSLTPEELDRFRKRGIGTLLIVPLTIGSRCFGVLTVRSRKPDAFDCRAIALAGELAAVVALAVENARFREEILGHVAEQARLLSASQDAEARYRTLVEQLPGATYVLRMNKTCGEIVTQYVSPQIEAIMGYPLERWHENPAFWMDVIHPEDRARSQAAAARCQSAGVRFSEEYRAIAADGRVVWVHDEATLLPGDSGESHLWQGIILDTTALVDAKLRQREAEAEFRLLFSRNPHPSWVLDRESLRIMEVNDIAVSRYGYGRAAFLDMHFTELMAEIPAEPVLQFPESQMPDSRRVGLTQHRTRDGRVIDVEVSSHELDFRSRPALLVMAHDVTEHLALEARLAHQAFHDSLTGLPNRARFRERLTHALLRRESVAVLFIDLDDFKLTNDTLGHNAGDALLVAVGERLARCLPPGDTLARLGGDEFTVLVEHGEEAAIANAERILRALAEPFEIAGMDIAVGASIGIAVGYGNEDATDDLLRRADIAMYRAKDRGASNFVVFDPTMDAGAWQRLAMDQELRKALREEQFVLHYQPIIDLMTGEPIEVEALVRWQHPTRGLLAPDEFIPVAEETGLIIPIGLWVLRNACEEAARWSLHNRDCQLVVGINLSARQFLQPSLVDEIVHVLDQTGLPASRLKVEITETVAMNDVDTSAATLRALKSIGVGLAMDDFGTGYSSLNYLRHCPIDTLKIDRSYIADLNANAANAALVGAVLEFARRLGLSVTAEGVETENQIAALKDMGCDRAQGFFFARAMDSDQLSGYITGTVAPVHV